MAMGWDTAFYAVAIASTLATVGMESASAAGAFDQPVSTGAKDATLARSQALDQAMRRHGSNQDLYGSIVTGTSDGTLGMPTVVGIPGPSGK